jgi:hypothetical protein
VDGALLRATKRRMEVIAKRRMEHCDDAAEVGHDEFYATPDELGSVAVKPGPKQRVDSSWRDATYIRIYGCASYYLKWQFKNVVKNVEYCIDYVVKNCSPENDNDEMYYKCSRLGSGSSASSYDYIKCIEEKACV